MHCLGTQHATKGMYCAINSSKLNHLPVAVAAPGAAAEDVASRLLRRGLLGCGAKSN